MPINLGAEACQSRGQRGEPAGRGEGERGLGRDTQGRKTTRALCHWQCLEHNPVQLAGQGLHRGRAGARWEASPAAAFLLTWLLSHPPETDRTRLPRESALTMVNVI